MSSRIERGARAISAAFLICTAAFLAAPAQAAERVASLGNSANSALSHIEQSSFATVGAVTRAPIGWVEFCIEYKPECDTTRSQPRDIVLTERAWADLVKVNDWVNRTIKPMTDLEHWGVVERWNYPDDGYGDCEDYVLMKRRMLMQAGWPRQALLITVVRDKKGDGHAVLTVKTDRGEYILDNQENEIVAWYRTGYRFVKRQSQSDQNTWVALGEPSAPAAVSAR